MKKSFLIILIIFAVGLVFCTGSNPMMNLPSEPLITSLEQGSGCRTQFEPEKLAIVDENISYGNLLIRGNFPLNCDTPRAFAYNQLEEKMKQLKGSSFNLADYEIILVSLINNAGNLNDLRAEENVFGLNPDSINCQNEYSDGTPELYRCLDKYRTTPYQNINPNHAPHQFYWWPLWICGADNCTTLDTYSACKFKDISENFNTLLNTEPPYSTGKKKRLIYFHCEHGCDRTGAVHAAYLMFKDRNSKLLNLQKAIDKAGEAIPQGNSCMKGGYVALLRKFCLDNYNKDAARCN
jgi:hypothetical protein